jgi:hypothetical protein
MRQWRSCDGAVGHWRGSLSLAWSVRLDGRGTGHMEGLTYSVCSVTGPLPWVHARSADGMKSVGVVVVVLVVQLEHSIKPLSGESIIE